MIYSNLLYLITALLALALGPSPEVPRFSTAGTALFFGIKLLLQQGGIRLYLLRRKDLGAGDFFRIEKILSVFSLLLLGVDIYYLDILYFLDKIPAAGQLPSLPIVAGLGIFFLYQGCLWGGLHGLYRKNHAGSVSRRGFVLSRLKILFSMVLPWLILTLGFDLVWLIPVERFQEFLQKPWGEAGFFLGLAALTILLMPWFLIRLWECTPLAEGEVRARINDFCLGQGVRFRDICSWPLFEGRIMTAGVVGLFRPGRYLILTPSLIEALTPEEIQAVVAHEIGHVKRWHLPLYFLILLSFGVLAQAAAGPFAVLFANSEFYYHLIQSYPGDPDTLLPIFTLAPLALAMFLFFRYIFGFFMRNFERQADYYAFKTMGEAAPLIRVFNKISWLNGIKRDQSNWHHFGLGQRIDFLEACTLNGSCGKSHHLKLYSSLATYLLVIVTGLLFTSRIDLSFFDGAQGRKIAEAMVTRKIESDPDNPLWHQIKGDLLTGRRRFREARTAYENSLSLQPDNSEALNNLAWLLLTAKDRSIIDYPRALQLARRAADLQRRGHILDTLAEALWLNKRVNEAVKTEREAIKIDPDNRQYYRDQIKKFTAG